MPGQYTANMDGHELIGVGLSELFRGIIHERQILRHMETTTRAVVRGHGSESRRSLYLSFSREIEELQARVNFLKDRVSAMHVERERIHIERRLERRRLESW